jgi:peroxiredoxin Q/BCP
MKVRNMTQSAMTGTIAPDFALPASTGKTISLAEYRGRLVVLFFYPKDMTPTCTQEACLFRDFLEPFQENGATVLGISPDPVRRHETFAAKHSLTYPLLSDEDLAVCKKYGVWKLKKRFGREYMGVERSTFLIDRQGRIAREWRDVRLKGHIEEVLEAVRQINKPKAAAGQTQPE